MSVSDDARWLVGSARTTGTGHVGDLGYQDASAFWSNGKSAVGVVCDGPGTLPYAALSAQNVTRALKELFVTHADALVSGAMGEATVLDVARNSLEDEARRLGEPLHKFGCTAVALLVHDGKFVTWSVGDSAAFILVRDIPVSITSRQEGADGGTFFVTTDHARPEMAVRNVPPDATGFVLASDGAECLWRTRSGTPNSYIALLAAELDMNDSRGMTTRIEEDIQPLTSDDVTVVAIRKEAITGVYGCPRCGGEVETKRNAYSDLLIVTCVGCSREVVMRFRGVERGSQLQARHRRGQRQQLESS